MTLKSWGRWVTAGCVVLAIAATSLLLGRSETAAVPSPSNTLPSGLAAFAELLRRDGYLIVTDSMEVPRLSSSDLAIAPILAGKGLLGESTELPKRTISALESHLQNGGRVMTLMVDTDFEKASKESAPRHIQLDPHSERLLTVDFTRVKDSTVTFSDEKNPYKIISETGEELVTLDSSKSGFWVHCHGAIGLSNRFFARSDNAEFYLNLVRMAAPTGTRIVFVQAGYADSQSLGLLGSFGEWAVALQWQVIVIGLVIFYTLGKRFGSLVEPVKVQRGTRQLVDSLADTMKRARMAGFSARLIAKEAMRKKKAQLRLPPSTPDSRIIADLESSNQALAQDLLEGDESSHVQDSVQKLDKFLIGLDMQNQARQNRTK